MAIGAESLATVCLDMSQLSLLLCFFNLIPIPPLDGSQVARYGFIILILALQFPALQRTLAVVTNKTFLMIAGWFGIS